VQAQVKLHVAHCRCNLSREQAAKLQVRPVEAPRTVGEEGDKADQILVYRHWHAHVRPRLGSGSLAHTDGCRQHVRQPFAQQHLVRQVGYALVWRERSQSRAAHFQVSRWDAELQPVEQVAVVFAGDQHGYVIGVHRRPPDLAQIANDGAHVQRA